MIKVPVVEYFTENMIAGGNKYAIGNYSVTPAEFGFFVNPGVVFDVYGFHVQISDGASFNQTDYGAISGGLVNGYQIFLSEDNVPVTPLFGGQLIKQNIDFFDFAETVSLSQWAGLAQTLIAHVPVFELFGEAFRLTEGQGLMVIFNDNLSGLVRHSLTAFGMAQANSLDDL